MIEFFSNSNATMYSSSRRKLLHTNSATEIHSNSYKQKIYNFVCKYVSIYRRLSTNEIFSPQYLVILKHMIVDLIAEENHEASIVIGMGNFVEINEPAAIVDLPNKRTILLNFPFIRNYFLFSVTSMNETTEFLVNSLTQKSIDDSFVDFYNAHKEKQLGYLENEERLLCDRNAAHQQLTLDAALDVITKLFVLADHVTYHYVSNSMKHKRDEGLGRLISAGPNEYIQDIIDDVI